MAPHLQSFMIETSLLLILLEAVSRHEFPGLEQSRKACNFLFGTDPPLPRPTGLNVSLFEQMCCIRRCDLLPVRPCQNLSQSTAT